MLAQRYNFDDYSSKGSTVHPAKKYHYKTAAVEAIADVPQSTVAEPNTGTLLANLVPKHLKKVLKGEQTCEVKVLL